jgi:hypothetical protein
MKETQKSDRTSVSVRHVISDCVNPRSVFGLSEKEKCIDEKEMEKRTKESDCVRELPEKGKSFDNTDNSLGTIRMEGQPFLVIKAEVTGGC